MPGAFLQTSAPALDKTSEPIGAGFSSGIGLGFGSLTVRAQILPAPTLDKNRSPTFVGSRILLWRGVLGYEHKFCNPSYHHPRGGE